PFKKPAPALTPEEQAVVDAERLAAGKPADAPVVENTKAEKPAKEPKAPKADKAPKPEGKLSALDAAVKVLSEAGVPMNTKDMIEQMASKGYWKSPGGATPAATLYSGILADMKKPTPRFKKVDRGQFTLA